MAVIEKANTVIFADKISTWAELSQHMQERLGEMAHYRGHRILFAVQDELEAVSLIALGIEAQLDFGVVQRARLNEALIRRLYDENVYVIDLNAEIKLPEASVAVTSQPGRISVLTSGTTGLPKLVPHSPASLNTFDKVRHLDAYQWFVPYQIGSYAWYQMVALGLFVADQGLVLGRAEYLMESFEAALCNGQITAISSTPTFWRQAALSVDPNAFAASSLRMISLGGEIVDQAILDYLKKTFPQATIKHIYASSEAGAALVVSDGKAGFDVALLREQGDKAVSVRIVDGKLYVRSRYGNSDAAGTWIDTGDLVEQVGDRIYFRGRADNLMINVGGQKVFPAVVEAQLLSHPDVIWAQVVAKKAPLMNYLPLAHVVLKPGVKPEQAEMELTQFCESCLPEYAVPRLWNFLDAVPLRASLKS